MQLKVPRKKAISGPLSSDSLYNILFPKVKNEYHSLTHLSLSYIKSKKHFTAVILTPSCSLVNYLEEINKRGHT